MTPHEMRSRFPYAARLVQRLIDAELIWSEAALHLSDDALLRIESGETSERDARLLLIARTEQRRRAKR